MVKLNQAVLLMFLTFFVELGLYSQIYNLEAKAVFIYEPEKKWSHFPSPSKTIIFQPLKNDSNFCYSYFVINIEASHKVIQDKSYSLKITKDYFTKEERDIINLPPVLRCDDPIFLNMGNEFRFQLVEINGID